MQNVNWINRKNLMTVAGLSLSLAGVLLSFAIYSRSYGVLKRENEFLKKQIAQAEHITNAVASADESKLERELEELDNRLLTSLEISEVLEELNRLAEDQSVRFLSVIPGASSPDRNQTVKIEMEGNYQALGEFLGVLDELDSGIGRVKNFELHRQEGQLALRMVLEIEFFKPMPETP